MDRSYKRTKEFLIKTILKNRSQEKDLRFRLINNKLTDKEHFLNFIHELCENLYYNIPIDENMKNQLEFFNIKKSFSGWFHVDNGFAKGNFINPNYIFQDVYCDIKQCHQTAYNFIVEHSMKDIKLLSGTIRPYEVGEGYLHSICSFKKDDIEYVFDGANFLLMDKNLYYKLFNFKEIQSLSRHTILKDKFLLSQKKINPKTILKNNAQYKLAKNFISISKRFSGMGFIIYLYDRQGYLLAAKAPIEELERKNNLALKELNDKVEETLGEDAYKY